MKKADLIYFVLVLVFTINTSARDILFDSYGKNYNNEVSNYSKIETDTIYYTENGVTYVSYDGGLTWSKLEEPKPNTIIETKVMNNNELQILNKSESKYTADISIYNSKGDIVKVFKAVKLLNNAEAILRIDELVSSVYLCIINTGSQIFTSKFVLSK